MNSSVKLILTLVLLGGLGLAGRVPRVANVRLTTEKSHLYPRDRQLILNPMSMIPGMGGSSNDSKDNGETTVMLLGVMERQQQIKKIKGLVDELHRNLENLKTMVNSEVSGLSTLANASLGTDKFIIDAK